MAAPSLTPSRVVAHEVMRDLRRGELLDRALERGARRLDARDLAWTRELLYGTQRLRGRIDHLLSARVRGGMDSLEPDELVTLVRLMKPVHAAALEYQDIWGGTLLTSK